MAPSQFTLRGPGNPYGPKVIGVMTQNPVALQVRTNFIIQAPAAKFAGKALQRALGWRACRAGRRSEGAHRAEHVSWCPGYTQTVTMGTLGDMSVGSNPGCNNPGTHAAVTSTPAARSPSGRARLPGPELQNVVIPGFMKYTAHGQDARRPERGQRSRGPSTSRSARPAAARSS